MQTFKSFETVLSSINEDNFEDIALSLFRLQAKENKIYNQYITYLGVNSQNVRSITEIPFLPISFFKDKDVVAGEWKPEARFLSSSTTGSVPSHHLVKDMSFYLRNTEAIFNQYYGRLDQYHFLALLPSYLERQGSSLIAMVDDFIKKSKSPYSAFYLNNKAELRDQLSQLSGMPGKVILWGVPFALLDFAEEGEIDLSDCIVMETGGMKGRRVETTRDEMHSYLCSRFHVDSIHSEYGMTELLSQAYSNGGGYFQGPPWMKILVRDINDPFAITEGPKNGGINVIDLANIYTCAFVETQDLGRISQNGNFEVLGRMDNSDVRGCNLLVG